MKSLTSETSPLAEATTAWVTGAQLSAEREAGALHSLRREAQRQLLIFPWPHRRFEGWRHFPLRDLGKVPATAPRRGGLSPEELPGASRLLERHGLAATVLIQGDTHCMAPGASFPEGLRAEPLAPRLDAARAGPAASLAPRREEPFSALNAALFREGIHLTLEAGRRVSAPLVLVHDAGASSEALLPRLRLELEADAELTLVELFQGGSEASLTSSVTEAVLGAGARLVHLRVQIEGEAATHLGSFEAELAEGATLVSRVFSLGGARTRLTSRARMSGPEASVTLEGVYLGRGEQHHEHHTWIEHAVERCRSEETYRGILDDAATAVFDGTIEVRRDAQQTEGAMENRNLLLSPDAVVHTKPRLEIDADDVKCSHGATVGQLDEAQLFYLRSRGFGPQEARGLLTLAFVRALADRVEEPRLRALVLDVLAERLPGVDATTLQAAEEAGR